MTNRRGKRKQGEEPVEAPEDSAPGVENAWADCCGTGQLNEHVSQEQILRGERKQGKTFSLTTRSSLQPPYRVL